MCTQNLAKIQNSDLSYELDKITNATNLDSDVDVFTHCIKNAIDECCPMVERSSKFEKTYPSPWLTDAIVKSSRMCERKYKKVRHLPLNESN